MTEQEARAAIVTWARNHFFVNDIRPDVQVLTIQHNEADEWEAELTVSTSADSPHVMLGVVVQWNRKVS